MREIKFRIWDIQTRRMWYTDEKESLKITMCFSPTSLYTTRPGSGYTPSVDGMMQYIGFKDKTGKKAYWDDIASDGTNPPFLITPDYHFLAWLSENKFTILGNKWENPELLKSAAIK